MQVLYFCSCSHWKNMTILPHFFTVRAVFEDQVGNGVGKSGACAAVLDVVFLEPFVWEFSPFSLFD